MRLKWSCNLFFLNLKFDFVEIQIEQIFSIVATLMMYVLVYDLPYFLFQNFNFCYKIFVN